MTFDEAGSIFAGIEKSSLETLRRDLLSAALRYAGLRAEWALALVSERQVLDRPRTAAHDVFIDACNILSRNMARIGEDIGWRTRLGDDRRTIGDFACYLHALLGVRAR